MPSSTNEFAKAERELVEEQQLQEKIVNEEFKIWKNCAFAFTTLYTHLRWIALLWFFNGYQQPAYLNQIWSSNFNRDKCNQ